MNGNDPRIEALEPENPYPSHMPRAALAPGENSLDNVNPVRVTNAAGKSVWRVRCRVRLWDGEPKSVVGTGSTKGEARAAARRRCDEWLSSSDRPTS